MSIKSKSNAVRGAKDPLFPTTVETASTILPVTTAGALATLPTTAPGERIEQMYQLADIFASIFEALDEHEHAIATTREAA